MSENTHWRKEFTPKQKKDLENQIIADTVQAMVKASKIDGPELTFTRAQKIITTGSAADIKPGKQQSPNRRQGIQNGLMVLSKKLEEQL